MASTRKKTTFYPRAAALALREKLAEPRLALPAPGQAYAFLACGRRGEKAGAGAAALPGNYHYLYVEELP